MKTLITGAIALALAATINLSAQNIQTTSTTEQNALQITQTNKQDNKLANKQTFSGQRILHRQNNKSQQNEVCDGTQKRLHKHINANQCDGSGRKVNNRGRR